MRSGRGCGQRHPRVADVDESPDQAEAIEALPKEVSERLSFGLLLLCAMLAYVAFYGGYRAHVECRGLMVAVLLLMFPIMLPLLFVALTALGVLWQVFNGKLDVARKYLHEFRDQAMLYYRSSSRLSVAYLVLVVCAIYSLYFRYDVYSTPGLGPYGRGNNPITISDRVTGQVGAAMYDDNCPPNDQP
jgi:hypothetical protein